MELIDMKAIVETGVKKLEIQEVATPIIQPDEVLVKIRANGLCTNDIRDYIGDTKWSYPRIGGHEFSGQIVEVGAEVNSNHFQIGDHVVKYIIPACGECHYCKIGRENLCVEIYTLPTFQNPNGISGFWGLAQYMAVKSKNLYKYPKHIPFEQSAFTEPLACVVNSVQRAKLEYGQEVLVIGGGVMGLMHVMLAKLQGTRVMLSEPNEERRKLGEKLGADFTFDPTKVDAVETVKDQTAGRGADVVFNTTAIPAIAQQAIAFTANGGQTYMFSSMHPNDPIPTDMGAIHSHEKVVTGTVSPTIPTFYRSVQLIAKGLIDITPLLDKIFDYEEAVEAFEYAMRPETLKTIITFD